MTRTYVSEAEAGHFGSLRDDVLARTACLTAHLDEAAAEKLLAAREWLAVRAAAGTLAPDKCEAAAWQLLRSWQPSLGILKLAERHADRPQPSMVATFQEGITIGSPAARASRPPCLLIHSVRDYAAAFGKGDSFA